MQRNIQIKDQEIDSLNDKVMALESERINDTKDKSTEIKTVNDNFKYVEMR